MECYLGRNFQTQTTVRQGKLLRKHFCFQGFVVLRSRFSSFCIPCQLFSGLLPSNFGYLWQIFTFYIIFSSVIRRSRREHRGLVHERRRQRRHFELPLSGSLAQRYDCAVAELKIFIVSPTYVLKQRADRKVNRLPFL